MNVKVPTPDRDYKVLVRCVTYNQSKYICDALNGFAIQETNFPFICIVVDDASKDGNQEVIRQYANDNCDISNAYVSEDDISVYMRVAHKTNTNCVYLFCMLKVNLYCKPEKQEIYKSYRVVCEYEALCEGDDYWTDPFKLQKQVDWMELHTEYSMCWHDAYVDENGVQTQYNRYKTDCDVPFVDLVVKGGDLCPTASLFYRLTCFFDYTNKVKENDLSFYVGDYPLQMYMGYVGKVRYMFQPMSVYRFLSSGSWSQNVRLLSIDDKVKLCDKEHQLLKNMNILTDYKYEHLFKQCWYLYAFRFNCVEKLYEEACRYYDLLDESFQRGISFKYRLVGLGYPNLAGFIINIISLKNKVFSK